MPPDSTHVDVNLALLGAALRYYFDTKDLSAAVSFANPYIVLGEAQDRKSTRLNSSH